MRKNGKVIFIFGCLLIAASLVLLFLLNAQTKRANRVNAEIVQAMEKVLPERRQETPDFERDAEMPALDLLGEDFIALLEIPSFGLKLPVCSTWAKEKVPSFPCRFHGSSYNGTLVIGGYDHPGQFDFFDRIQTDTVVTVTDMTGGIFSYVVERVDRSDTAQAEVLLDDSADLTVFVRDAQLLEYIMLRCIAK